MRIAIRADGGSTIGMGHIMRTLVLAKELAKTNDVFYISKPGLPFIGGIKRVEQEGIKVELINLHDTIEYLLKVDADVLITDSYDVDNRYFKTTKNHFKKTVYIDDLNNQYYDVDFIINQNLGTEDWEYNCCLSCTKLLGTKYALLRNEFRESYPITINERVNNILITMGGSDPVNATKRIINSVREMDKTFHIIIGKNFKDIEFYKRVEEGNRNFVFYYEPKVSDVMKKCDIAITACGSTVYELLSLGIPSLGIVIADNQELIAQNAAHEEILTNLGHICDVEKKSY